MNENENDKLLVYYKIENIIQKKEEENKLKLILKEHIKAKDRKKLILRSYYKPLKLSSCFSTREALSDGESSNVVYRF